MQSRPHSTSISTLLRRLPPATLFALAACGGSSGYVEPPPPAVDVAHPVSQTVTEYYEMTGFTESVRTVEIRARVAGFLQSIEFDEGDYVEEGALLYTIDAAEYRARVRRAGGARDVAKATLELREATLERLAAARKSNAVSELEVIEARAEREVAAAELDSREAELKNANLNLSYTRIHAPTNGRVGRTHVDPGNLVGAGEKTFLTRVVQYNPIYAYFNINERAVLAMTDSTVDVSDAKERLAELRKIEVDLGRSNDDGYPFKGHLHYADLDVDAATGTYLLRAIYDNPEPTVLIPGLFVRGRIAVEEHEGRLLVPDRALGSDQSGKYLLVVDKEDVAQYRQVKAGSLQGQMRVILEGIEPEDRVITNGLLQARPGSKVAPNLVELDSD